MLVADVVVCAALVEAYTYVRATKARGEQERLERQAHWRVARERAQAAEQRRLAIARVGRLEASAAHWSVS